MYSLQLNSIPRPHVFSHKRFAQRSRRPLIVKPLHSNTTESERNYGGGQTEAQTPSKDAADSFRLLRRREVLTSGLSLTLLSTGQTALAESGALPPPPEGLAVATFAGGCFWCMEPPFDKTEGVIATVSGYCGGKEQSPTYKMVSAGQTGHAEALQVLYDPAKVSYGQLLDIFWHQINPTQRNRQFCDSGRQYRSAIFYGTNEEKRAAEDSLAAYSKLGIFKGPIVTEITRAGPFWPAEEYHQDYYLKNSALYKYYRYRCGRDAYLDKIWGTSNYQEVPAPWAIQG